MGLLLNCDLGESFGPWTKGVDHRVMPYIDQASIACGFHAGDPLVIKQTLGLAAEHGVAIGAHPSYPDLAGFGRRSMKLAATELIAILQYQIAALAGMAQNIGLSLSYVKPHGALYNDMMVNGQLRSAVMQAIAECDLPLAFMLQATSDWELHRAEAEAFGIHPLFEVFADRCYQDSGALLPRAESGAVLGREKMLDQVRQLREDSSVTTVSGKRLALTADTLCVHGDNPDAVSAIGDIRQLLSP